MAESPIDSSEQAGENLPAVLAGPVLRRVTPRQLVLWVVGSRSLVVRLRLETISDDEASSPFFDRELHDGEVKQVRVGRYAVIHLIQVDFDDSLPVEVRIGYDLGVDSDGAEAWIKSWAPHLCLPGADRPDFVIKTRMDRIFHGSCRRPQHPAKDALFRVDAELQGAANSAEMRPALMLMTGDQVYVDDVAGPMLRAIHALGAALGLYGEDLEGALVSDSEALLQHPKTYYARDQLLPATKSNEALVERFIGGVRKPVFTTSSAQNHLITLSEVMAMYLLVWSPVCWQLLQLTIPDLTEEKRQRYESERQCLEGFVATLPQAARAMAHFPTYMIFDDHDITDDWNLSALWEATVYEHAFSRRIVGNALIAYLLCQAWGNEPPVFAELMPQVDDLLESAKQSGKLDNARQNSLIDRLLTFNHWHYRLATFPPLVVLDTRTRRWRSELARGRPSGLMDWEALTEFQQMIMGEQSVIVVSPAPMFGVKLIETIQRVFTWFGRPLIVDAENWMAHRGAASVLINIFAHSLTPENFTILSGDVHYSFVYDVRLRHRRDSPRIWQITSSGLKNEFPEPLLERLDKLNRWLYSPRSPLNWLTKRRRMRITPRLPTGREAGERLWNAAGVGLVVFDEQGAPVEIRQLNASEGETRFVAAGTEE